MTTETIPAHIQPSITVDRDSRGNLQATICGQAAHDLYFDELKADGWQDFKQDVWELEKAGVFKGVLLKRGEDNSKSFTPSRPLAQASR